MAMVEGWEFFRPTGNILSKTKLVRKRKYVGVLRDIEVQHIKFVPAAEIIGEASKGGAARFRNPIVDDDKICDIFQLPWPYT